MYEACKAGDLITLEAQRAHGQLEKMHKIDWHEIGSNMESFMQD